MTDTTTAAAATAAATAYAAGYDVRPNILDHAAAIVVVNGWVQGSFVDYDAAARVALHAAPVDAVGAIRLAAGLDPDDSTGTPAELLFAAWLTEHGLVTGEPKLWASFEQIAEWNDHPARTLAEVAAALRRAAHDIARPTTQHGEEGDR